MSLRAAKRRSNPDGEAPTHWIASSLTAILLPRPRNDATNHNGLKARNPHEQIGHCEPQSGEAIQPGKPHTLDCFAPLAMTGGPLTMTGGELSLRAAHRAGETI
ncbi:MAG: hypothetical protein LBT00_09560 [Spirochaetaceae bacterium]|nr:hypothetical protein [Spirochaetaceae bacterium]